MLDWSFIDHVTVAKQRDNGIGSVRPSVHPCVCRSIRKIPSICAPVLGRPVDFQTFCPLGHFAPQGQNVSRRGEMSYQDGGAKCPSHTCLDLEGWLDPGGGAKWLTQLRGKLSIGQVDHQGWVLTLLTLSASYVHPPSIQGFLRSLLVCPDYLYPPRWHMSLGKSLDSHSTKVAKKKSLQWHLTCLALIDWFLITYWLVWSLIEHIMTCSKGCDTRLE